MPTYYTYHSTPVGELLLAGDGNQLTRLGFPTGTMRRRHDADWRADAGPFQRVIAQLDAYFAGELKRFSLPLAPAGTRFQCEVWAALRKIPYGQTRSYGELARLLGNPKASRAVGAANGQNPIPVIIPCHRVVGSSGHLTGFGGGLATKQFLLQLEAQA